MSCKRNTATTVRCIYYCESQWAVKAEIMNQHCKTTGETRILSWKVPALSKTLVIKESALFVYAFACFGDYPSLQFELENTYVYISY